MSDENALTIMRHLPVPIDSYRKNILADELAQARQEELRITDHMKRVQQSLREQIKEQTRRQNVASQAIAQGFEMRPVECRQEVDLAGNRVIVYREDTGKVVEERALDPKERERLLKARKP